MRFFRITQAQLPQWQEQLEALERLSEYPLGRDWFQISHGENYFAFFERMGDVAYYGLEEDKQLVAVGCGILRPAQPGHKRCWYVSDIKVHPKFRGRHFMVHLFARAFFQNYVRCPRGYAVAMDAPDGEMPPSLRSIQHFKWLSAASTGYLRLNIYSADEKRTRELWPVVTFGRAEARLLSLRGVKDLVLKSSQAPLPLLHVSFSARPAPVVFVKPQPGYTHMWCAPQHSPVAQAMARLHVNPTATATVLHHRLPGFDGSTIETAEI